MRFDHTEGKKAKYMVSLYGWNVHDVYYYHYGREAKAAFEALKGKPNKPGTVISIYDMVTDTRKAFYKF